MQYLDEELIEFYGNMSQIYSFETDRIEDEIDIVLFEFLGYNRTDLHAMYENELHGMNNKRHKWAKKALKNREEFQITDTKSFFRNIVLELARRPGECKERYGTTSPQEVADKICEEIQEWRKSDRPFVAFPTFPDVGRITPYNVFKADLKMNILIIIMREFGGNIHNWSVKHISDLVTMPIFSGQSGTVPVEEYSQKLYATIFDQAGYMVRYTDLDPAITSLETKIPVFNKTDMEVASFLLNNTEYDITGLQSDTEQITTLSMIASNVFHTKRPTQVQKEKIREHLSKLSNKIEIRDRDSGYEYAWTIIDHYEILPKDYAGVSQVRYALGDEVRKRTWERRLMAVPSSRFNNLKTGYAKTLYFQLQMQRINLAKEGGSMTKSFSISFFSRAMLLRYKGTARIKTIIKNTLDELKEKTELFKKYTIKGREYIIQFCDLEADELADLAKEKYVSYELENNMKEQ